MSISIRLTIRYWMQNPDPNGPDELERCFAHAARDAVKNNRKIRVEVDSSEEVYHHCTECDVEERSNGR